jgi:hypothetical protein
VHLDSLLNEQKLSTALILYPDPVNIFHIGSVLKTWNLSKI